MENTLQKPSRPRLSVAMIVRNEQEVLAESIDSVRAIADEIVVLDTGSTDRTPEVAAGLGALVTQAAWTDDFSAARNRCLDKTTGDWVLWLDAGQRLDADSADALRRFVDGQADRAKTYLLSVVVPPAEPCGSSEQVAQLRLMPNRAGLRFVGRVRETLRPAIEAAGMRIDACPGRLLCHTRRHDPARKAACARRDLALIAAEIAETDRTPPARLRIAEGEAYGNLDDPQQARRGFREAIEAAEHGSTEMLEAYYGLLATYQSGRFEPELQLNACLEALEVFPCDAQLLLAMGNCLQAQNRIDLACRSFDLAVRHGQINLETWQLSEMDEVAAGCLNVTLQLRDEDGQAQAVLEDALERHPNSMRLRRHLIELHVKRGRTRKAVDLVEQLAADEDSRRPLRDAVLGASEAARGQWIAALGYLQGAYVAGCRDPICLRWLSVTLLSNGQIDAARPVLNEWQQLEPGSAELEAYLSAIGPSEAAPSAQRQPSAQDGSAAPAGRRLRVDPGATVPQTALPQSPAVGQNAAADTAPHSS